MSRSRLALLGFLVIVVGGGWLIGAANPPGDWHARLAKPSFNPPNAVFPVAWIILYVLIAVAGWRTWQNQKRSLAMLLWAAQLALNFSWSPVMFRLHAIGAALGIIVVLLVAIAGFVAVQWPRDRIAAYLFLPYAAWVAFATILNAAIWRLN